jgi:hypothetical protein
MRPQRPGGFPVVIELAGLPGAGKTSLTTAVTTPHVGRRDFYWTEAVFARPDWPVIRAAFRLASAIRPFRFHNLHRALKLVFALRSYRRSERRLVIMDQGMVQKLWSLVIETGSYPPQRLEEIVQALAPFAPDHLVWVTVPPALAAQRIAGRSGGNSRFDGKAPAVVEARLLQLEETYQLVIGLFAKFAGMPVLTLDGEADLTSNARVIDDLAATYLAAREHTA